MTKLFLSIRRNRHGYESVVFGTLGVLLLVYSLYSHSQVDTPWKLSPYLFPVFIAVLLVLVSTSMFLQGRTSPHKESDPLGRKLSHRVAGFVALVLVYYFLLPILGFLLTDTVMLTLFMLYLGVRPWWKSLILSVALTVIIYVVFQVLLNVRLPQGFF